MKKLKLATIGCGSRASTYANLASKMPDRYEIVGGADPIAWKIERVARCSNSPNFHRFKDANELLAADKFADVLIIATQDSYHIEPCIAAMEKGYDVLLEKPIATTAADVLKLHAAADRLGRRVLICHVLRYTAFYQKIKSIIDAGTLGEVMTLQASEGVGTFHQAHSFVRGHWAVTEKSSPMIIAKSCHDTDIISWMMGRPCTEVASFGRLGYFTPANKPEGAPHYCIEGCPVGDSCQYNAERYLTDQRGWLSYVFNSHQNPSDADIRAWLATSQWGRCVYQSDNTAVDHQVLAMRFTGNATATFTMSAFDTGRNIELWGTKAILKGGTYTQKHAGCDILITDHATGASTKINVRSKEGGYDSHDGGDAGLAEALYEEMTSTDPQSMRSSLAVSVQSHLIGFAAEAARVSGQVVRIEDFRIAQEYT